jgi:hypothetical protein
MIRLLSLIVFLMLSGTMAATAMAQQQPGHRGSAQEGKRLALGKCDVCHVVASDQLYQPLLSQYAPSFYDVGQPAEYDGAVIAGVSRLPSFLREYALPRPHARSGDGHCQLYSQPAGIALDLVGRTTPLTEPVCDADSRPTRAAG